MSILIKGIQMPKSCMDCPLFESLYHFHGCHAKPESFNDRDMWNFFVGDRPTWCPLVEVPVPHGRLLDADDVFHVLTSYYHHSTDFQHEALKEALARVSTIIEAEDGE